MPRRYVAVCGASDATASQLESAREVGRLLAESGVVIINGGLGGVSGAASEGAAQAARALNFVTECTSRFATKL